MKGPVYTCTKCDAQFPKWSGRCTSCGAWGSIGQEARSEKREDASRPKAAPGATASFAEDSAVTHANAEPTGFATVDRLLAGGIVEGSMTLVAGEPGVGKSTLLAQLALVVAGAGKTVLYVTGEESPSQIKRRLQRLSKDIPKGLRFLDTTDAPTIAATVVDIGPALTIVDSVQTLRCADASGEPGSVTQVKACAATLTEAAKRSKHPVILVGQVTKDGDVAGPRLLEHIVDTVLFLEGDRMHRYRLLRLLKHRFGPTDDIALLSMTEKGLEAVEDASTELLRDRPANAAGSSVSCIIEGRRPLLIEIQALVSPAGYSTPVRRTTGIDPARLGMLLAVLARRSGVQALDKDVYANAAGGFDARDPSVDLAVATAIASAIKDTPLDPRLALFGEVGLAGELRPVSLPDARLKEMSRLGFRIAIVPKGQAKHAPKGLDAKEASSLREAFQIMRIV
ncbi:DNA repair protein RadA [Patescibacteria group bacterium]|nr:DNA repair protein RadA [Patescibacteria group bacterium]MBU1448215.1 DNA repair protein RadA [Patescibacteria group bacterium]MBU2613000.1 DNA repair protein RadA [Patescibacteria group bacterium]